MWLMEAKVLSEPLTSLSANEFYDVWRQFNTGGREEFDAEWAKFQEWKAERAARMGVQ